MWVWVRGDIEITIDTWPRLNPFVKIEDENEKVVREVSKEPSFGFEESVFGNIDLIYEKELSILAEIFICRKSLL